MEAKLRENDHKGGWDVNTDQELMWRLLDEMAELRHALTYGDAESIVKECADVANFAMFIADNTEARAWQDSVAGRSSCRRESTPVEAAPVEIRNEAKDATTSPD